MSYPGNLFDDAQPRRNDERVLISDHGLRRIVDDVVVLIEQVLPHTSILKDQETRAYTSEIKMEICRAESWHHLILATRRSYAIGQDTYSVDTVHRVQVFDARTRRRSSQAALQCQHYNSEGLTSEHVD